ncbi:4a-hydroxytetrahydrobiopterin dehydratase [Acidiferrobacter sp.]|uniref:4a-hydroxytetrahydrobiopterin dehydratase n=1 Tax=Acidiferrobacter sp. TaxID=1872107 RepID=UPI002611AE91|nr:4a-hydroxytetrahydrobiopterin dehydratase [Acidiferrobacter sp.]
MTELRKQSCRPCEGGVEPMDLRQARDLMAQIPQWTLDEAAPALVRDFRFANFYETMAFVNAIAYIAHREDHHPDLRVGYNECVVRYQTHAIGGLSDNDFICAAKIDALGI